MKAAHFGPVFAIPTFAVKVLGEGGCTVTGSFDLAKSQAECYRSNRPADATVQIFYSESCGHCSGAGKVFVARRRSVYSRTKPCPVCKGAPEFLPDTLISVAS